ncbi:MAG TPA: YCF48-related protein [Steroidobacteraceae bacterium]|nr:YCF48-related protein [Steroidobacteraceae bacterium]
MRGALAACALALVPPALAQDAPPDDPAARPSVIAPLASRSLLLDLARAGPRVFAVGERGHVLYSDDEGKAWTQVEVPGSANLTAVYFSDARHGCAVGHVEMILCTRDGGNSWELAHFAPENQQPLLDVWFADGERGIATGAYGVIYTTTDGGRIWSQVPFEPLPLDGPVQAEAPPPEDMEAEVDLGFEFHLNAIARGPGQRVYLGAEAGRLFRSDDDGASWRELPSPYDGSFYGILPLDGDALLAFGLRGNLFRSDDGGMSWTQIETGTVALLNAGARLDADTVVVVGMAGVQLASHDGGRTFTLHQREDRQALSAVLPAADGALIVAGEGGVMRTTLPGIGGGAR